MAVNKTTTTGSPSPFHDHNGGRSGRRSIPTRITFAPNLSLTLCILRNATPQENAQTPTPDRRPTTGDRRTRSPVIRPQSQSPSSFIAFPSQYLTRYNNIVIILSAVWEIEYHETSRGRCPVQDFIDSLDFRSRAKVARTLDLLEQFGVKLEMPFAKHVEGDLWELRARVGTDQYRIIYFLFSGGVFILLHGFMKKTGRIAQRDLETARDRRNDFVSRRRR